MGLPCRGQRTKTNARTRRGPRNKQSQVRRNNKGGILWLRKQLDPKRKRKTYESGAAHIRSTFNNTIVTVTGL